MLILNKMVHKAINNLAMIVNESQLRTSRMNYQMKLMIRKAQCIKCCKKQAIIWIITKLSVPPKYFA